MLTNKTISLHGLFRKKNSGKRSKNLESMIKILNKR